MSLICIGCKEEFVGKSSKLILCPFCSTPIIDKNKYLKIKEEINYNKFNESDLDNILKNEEKVYDKIDGSILEKCKDYIDALFKLLKDPNESLANKISSIIALVYVINPIDLIPDIIPLLGLVDDFAAITIAIGAIGTAINKYYKKHEKNIKLDNNTIIYNISSTNSEVSIVKAKRNMIIWTIPANKKSKINIRTINNKAITANKYYVVSNIVDNFLTPLDDFDNIVSESIFNEAVNIFKSLGAKKVRFNKKTAKAFEKNIVHKAEYLNVFDGTNKVDSRKVAKEEISANYEFDELGVENILNSNELVEEMNWYFTDNSILDESIFSDRLQKGMLKTNIKKDIELNSLLNMDSRINVMKDKDISMNINISEASKVRWEIEVEYYPLDKNNLNNISKLYDDLKNKINDKKENLKFNYDL